MKRGFTLIEILIYLLIIGGVVASFVAFTIGVGNSSAKNYVVQEVHGNTRTGLGLITSRIRAATGVQAGSSTFGTDPGVLSLVMADSAKNPTVISLSGDDGVLQIIEGTGSAVAITSDEVKVTNSASLYNPRTNLRAPHGANVPTSLKLYNLDRMICNIQPNRAFFEYINHLFLPKNSP